MDKVLLVLVVAGLAIGVVLVGSTMMNNRNVSSANIEERPAKRTPQSNETAEDSKMARQTTENPSGDEKVRVVSDRVKSLDFKVEVRSNGERYSSRFRIRHPGDDNEDVRIDTTRGDGAEMTIILRGSTDEGWVNDYSSGEWTHFTGIAFTQMWQTRSDQYMAYKAGEWESMEGREFTLENEDGTARVYDVSVNGNTPNSVFYPG